MNNSKTYTLMVLLIVVTGVNYVFPVPYFTEITLALGAAGGAAMRHAIAKLMNELQLVTGGIDVEK